MASYREAALLLPSSFYSLSSYIFFYSYCMYTVHNIIITYYVCLAGDLPYLHIPLAALRLSNSTHTVPQFCAHAVPSAGTTTQQQLFCLLPTTDHHLPQQPLRREAAPTLAAKD